MLYDSNSQRKYIVLNMIHHLGPISRTSLIELTGFRPATIGAIVSDFIVEKLVVETENISVGHGRKRILLEINNDHVCALCISIAPRHVSFIVSRFDGRLLANEKIDFTANAPTEEQILSITEKVKALLHAYSDRNIVGIGLCKFLFEYDFNATAVDKWLDEVLKPRLEAITDLPLQQFSDVTLPAIAEQRYGVAKGKKDFLWVNITRDLRVSLFCNGQAIGGTAGAAGALGHTTIDLSSNDDVCHCGKVGCVEHTTAWPALVNKIVSAINRGVVTKLNDHNADLNNLHHKDIRRALDAGDRMCIHYVRDCAQKIGLAIANAATLLNPEMIVLHGFMLYLGPHFRDELESTIRSNIFPENKDLEICISYDFENPMMLGAVAEIFSAYLHAEDYRWVYHLEVNGHE